MSKLKKYQLWPEHPQAMVIDSDQTKAQKMAESLIKIFPHLEVRVIKDNLEFLLIQETVGEHPPDLVIIGDLKQFTLHPDFGRSVARIAILIVSCNLNAVLVQTGRERPSGKLPAGVDMYHYAEYSIGSLRDGIIDVDAEE